MVLPLEVTIRIIASIASIHVVQGKARPDGRPGNQYVTLTELQTGDSIQLTSAELDFSKLAAPAEAGLPRFFDLDIEVQPRTFRNDGGSSQVLQVVRMNQAPKERKITLS